MGGVSERAAGARSSGQRARRGHSYISALLLTLAIFCGAALAHAGVDAGSADAGTPLTAPDVARIEKLGVTQRAVEALQRGELAPGVDPSGLFPVELNDELAIAMEVARLRAVSAHLGVAQRAAERRERHLGDAGSAAIAPAVWQALVARDRAWLEFLELPAARRRELLMLHARRQEEAQRAAPSVAQAERRAEEARRAEQQAREAALRARSEAMRVLEEERARLLSVSGAQADFAADMERRRARVSELQEVTLGWQRRSREIREGGSVPALVDALYDELRRALRRSREQLSSQLDELAASTTRVPRPGPGRLADLPVQVDTAEVIALRTRLLLETERLDQADRELQEATGAVLFEQIVVLNRERLALLPHLSEAKRDAITGLTVAGLEQAASELRQLVLILRYNRYQSANWLAARLSRDARWGSALMHVALLLLEWLLCIALFLWWRKNARRRFEVWLGAVRKRDRQLRLSEPSFTERALVFVAKVHRPIEWLALCSALWWFLPSEAQGLLELQLVAVVVGWVLAGAVVVSVVNALADRPRAVALASQNAALRLRSLRLVGRVIIGFGLVLSISARLVGRGTIYEWIELFSWFAGLPIFLILVRWWRPSVFQRLARQRKHTAFESWVQENRTGWTSFIAAMSGTVFLFVRGLSRVLLRWLGTFDITRKGLAWLFQRELEKLGSERAAMAGHLGALPPDVYAQLGPSVSSVRHVKTDIDEALASLLPPVERGGRLIAVTGERGLGKTTVLTGLRARYERSLMIVPARGTLAEITGALQSALKLSKEVTLTEAAEALDAPGGPPAVLIDDAHRLIQPVEGGLESFDELIAVARAHSHRVNWVFSFQDAIWQFLEQSRGAYPRFDEVLDLLRWREPQIAELLRVRSAQVGVEPSFEHLLERLPPNADSIDREEALAERASGYYRLIWDYSNGNPGVALDVWRRALAVDASGRIWVTLFPALNTGELERLPDEAMFVLRAVLQMAPAVPGDIERATLLSAAQVADVLRYSVARGFLELGQEGYRVTWTWLRPLIRLLYRKHLLVPT